jgi:acetyltransferase
VRRAIRPYPVQYVKPWPLGDGTEILIRPIRPEDEPLMVRFHATLSERSVYLRYFHLSSLDYRVSHERLRRICFVDYDREIALVAELRNPVNEEPEILAVGRLAKADRANEAECAILIGDTFQHRGLGTEMIRRLVEIARDEKLSKVTADILPENDHMLSLCKALGFRLRYSTEDRVIKAELLLSAPTESGSVPIEL